MYVQVCTKYKASYRLCEQCSTVLHCTFLLKETVSRDELGFCWLNINGKILGRIGVAHILTVIYVI
jgi:hypothetical protein